MVIHIEVAFSIADASKHSVKVEPLKHHGEKPLVSADKMNKFWSPSLACGLSTPPPSTNTQTFELPLSGYAHSQLVAPGITNRTHTIILIAVVCH